MWTLDQVKVCCAWREREVYKVFRVSSIGTFW